MAIDDCTRWRVLALYSKRTADNAVDFLVEHVLEEMPFPIQHVQTDRGGEFFGLAYQRALRGRGIKFRPNRSGAPHLNGRVQCSQQTDKMEFWATMDLKLPLPQIEEALAQWQTYYNWERPHATFEGQSPMDYWGSLSTDSPSWDKVIDAFDEEDQPFRIRNYKQDLRLRKLKLSG